LFSLVLSVVPQASGHQRGRDRNHIVSLAAGKIT